MADILQQYLYSFAQKYMRARKRKETVIKTRRAENRGYKALCNLWRTVGAFDYKQLTANTVFF